MTVRILVVCTANICRSPSAGLLLARRLADTALGTDVLVVSAGAATRDGLSLCPAAGRLLEPLAGADAAALAGTHRSTVLTASHVASADLVLTASRTHLAAVAHLAPGAVDRSFTIREASTLGARVLDLIGSDVLADAPPLPDDTEGRLRWLIGEMHAVRGHARPVPPEPVRTRWWQRPPPAPPHPYDVPDSHEGGPDVHDETMRLIAESVDTWVGSVAAVLALPAVQR